MYQKIHPLYFVSAAAALPSRLFLWPFHRPVNGGGKDIPPPFYALPPYKMMQIKPPQPSLIIRSIVSCSRSLASGGMR